MDAAIDPTPVLDTLNRHGVRYVVIGGYAATLHASPFITWDVDVTPERSADNLDRLSAALNELEARVWTATEPDGIEFQHNGRTLGESGVGKLMTAHGRLDISFVPNGTEGFADLDRDAEEVEIDGVRIRIASLADIIRSKQAGNRPKDQRVLPTLREILASRHTR